MFEGFDKRAAARWVAIRIAALPLIFLVVSFASYFLLFGPFGDDPAERIAGQGATPSQLEFIRDEFNLDDPWLKGYVLWLGDLLRGDLGTEFRSAEPITDLLREKLPPTIQLTAMSFVSALAIGVIVAYVMTRRGAVGRAGVVASSVLGSVPYFITLTLLIIIPLVLWDYAQPVGGYVSFFDEPVTNLRLLGPTSFLIGAATSPLIARVCVDRVPFGEGVVVWLATCAVALMAWFPLGVAATIVAEPIMAIRGIGEWYFNAVFSQELYVVHLLLTLVTLVGISFRMFSPGTSGFPTYVTGEDRFTNLRDPLVLVGAGILLSLLVVAIIGPFITPYDPREFSTGERFEGPSWDHWFGTSRFGQDLLTRLIYGVGDSLRFAAWVVGMGTTIGLIAAWMLVAAVPASTHHATRLLQLVLGASALWWVLAVVAAFSPDVIAVFSPGVWTLGGVLGLGVSVVVTLRAIEISPTRDGWVQRLRHRASSLIGTLALISSSVTMVYLTLDFLGFTNDRNGPSLGVEAFRGFADGADYPHLIIFPAITMGVLLFAFNIIGETLHALERRHVAGADEPSSAATTDSS
jgi:ABC-type dipeptide/oligopeptide/nickel transport system permease component/ABC-type dipeptide/oligopeptide/nickel transport system permease subunit